MKRLLTVALALALAFGLTTGLAFGAGLEITPPSDAALEALLQKLAHDTRQPQWCESECATFYRMRFSGALEKGTVDFVLEGAVTSRLPSLVPLFGTRPDAGLDGATGSRGEAVPIYFVGGTYRTVLAPGDFTLRGSLRFAPGSALTLQVPGPAGLVEIEVQDADVVGSGERQGMTEATYQLTPKQRAAVQAPSRTRLRLQLERRFDLARDKTFSVDITAQGAKAGEVIRLPLLAGEQIETLDESQAHVVDQDGARHLEWIAADASPSLSYAGKWTAEAIALEAPAGAVKEHWEVSCDDPYRCTFAGDAEPETGAARHAWEPLAGQRLQVTWKELAPMEGIHTIAESAELASRVVGKNLQQRLRVEYSSSTGSLVSLTLPKDALVSRFELNGEATPLLRDKDGALQLGLATGRSTLEANWEIAGGGSLFVHPPVPRFSVPVGTLWHAIVPAEGRDVLMTGGLAGSPRVALWPNLVVCLVLALLLWALARWAEAPLASPGLWIASGLGFAIASPLAALPLVLALGLGRFLGRIPRQRGRVRMAFELALWAVVILVALGAVFATLQEALFSPSPLEVTSFVRLPSDILKDGWYDAVRFGAYVAGAAGAETALPSPWAMTLPLLVIRLVWAAWAIAIAVFLAREGKLAVAQLTAYWKMARGALAPQADDAGEA